MYKFGKITLTQQALVVFIMGTVLSLFSLLYNRSAKGAGISVGIFAFTCYTTYLTNCLTVGDCNELAWVLVILNAISVSLAAYRIKNKNM